jgi:hypothetical protein
MRRSNLAGWTVEQGRPRIANRTFVNHVRVLDKAQSNLLRRNITAYVSLEAICSESATAQRQPCVPHKAERSFSPAFVCVCCLVR